MNKLIGVQKTCKSCGVPIPSNRSFCSLECSHKDYLSRHPAPTSSSDNVNLEHEGDNSIPGLSARSSVTSQLNEPFKSKFETLSNITFGQKRSNQS